MRSLLSAAEDLQVSLLTIITMDESYLSEEKGKTIRVVRIADWLLGKLPERIVTSDK